MRFIFYSPQILGNAWNWTSGGGSETYQTEMTRRLAARGHEVVSYAPLPCEIDGSPSRDRVNARVSWRDVSSVDWTLPGIWVMQRNPLLIDNFLPRHDDQKLWFVCHDWNYPFHDAAGAFVDWPATFDRVICLSAAHAKFMCTAYPTANVTQGRTGLAVENVQAPINERNPHGMVFASSPIRGLLPLLKIFTRARELVEDLTLQVFFGWEQIDAQIASLSQGAPTDKTESVRLARLKAQLVKALNQPGVTWRGRASKTEVYQAMASAGMYVYPCTFPEVACVSVMEAAASGALLVVTPLAALAEVPNGYAVDGDPEAPITQARFVQQIVRIAQNSPETTLFRARTIADARQCHDIERAVDQFEEWSTPLTEEGVQTERADLERRRVIGELLREGAGHRAKIRLPKQALPCKLAQQAPMRAQNGEPLGWFAPEARKRLEVLLRAHNVRTVIEIGSFLGQSAAWFARRVEHVYCVDTWRETATVANKNNLVETLTEFSLPTDFFECFRQNMIEQGVWENITVVRGLSRDVVSQLPMVDLVYIDGDHSAEGCAEDIRAYLPLARKIICGDDYGYRHTRKEIRKEFGVIESVDALLPHRSLDMPFWWAETVERKEETVKSVMEFMNA